jgi:hypothetical protein
MTGCVVQAIENQPMENEVAGEQLVAESVTCNLLCLPHSLNLGSAIDEENLIASIDNMAAVVTTG